MRMPSPAGRRPGFTLLELVVALAIVGVVLGVAGPAFIVRGESTSVDATAPVVRTLARARRTALESARLTTVTIDPISARVWVRTEGKGSNVDTAFTLTLPRDAELSSARPRAQFAFAPNGGGSGDSLTVTSPTGRAIVTIDRASGDPRVTSPVARMSGRAAP